MSSNTRLAAVVLAGVLLLGVVAVLAYAAGASSSGRSAPTAQSSPIAGQFGNGFGPGQGRHGFGFRGRNVPTLSGAVTAVGSGSVTIDQGRGSTRTLTLTGSTNYTEAGTTVGQSALIVGVRIVAQGTVDSSGNFTATSVTIQPSVVIGTVASKTSSSITVTTAAGKTVTVNVTSSTKYTVRGVSSATLDNISAGYLIQAQGTLNSDGSLNALVVSATPNVRQAMPGFGGRGGSPRVPGLPGSGSQTSSAPSASPSGSNI